ncbi:hypothetical protein OROMI_015391 [Orobanche minor]
MNIVNSLSSFPFHLFFLANPKSKSKERPCSWFYILYPTILPSAGIKSTGASDLILTKPYLGMDIGSAASRHLSFEDVSEEPDQHANDIIDDHTKMQLVNYTILINEKDVPEIGLSFDSERDAYDFYLKFSKRVGFGIRKHKSHRDKSGETVDRIFCCSAQGKRAHEKRDIYSKKVRPETRFGCLAQMKVSRRVTRKFCVVQFVSDHNHYLSN